jgi:hypothetical protein
VADHVFGSDLGRNLQVWDPSVRSFLVGVSSLSLSHYFMEWLYQRRHHGMVVEMLLKYSIITVTVGFFWPVFCCCSFFYFNLLYLEANNFLARWSEETWTCTSSKSINYGEFSFRLFFSTVGWWQSRNWISNEWAARQCPLDLLWLSLLLMLMLALNFNFPIADFSCLGHT